MNIRHSQPESLFQSASKRRSSRGNEAQISPFSGAHKRIGQSLLTSAATNSKRAAFTILEIAIALGVIGFALVAIVGILPTGLNVEKENREETLINQDGPLFMEAIRSGAQGLGMLTNFVDSITVTEKSVNPDVVTVYTNSGTITSVGGTNYNGHMTNASWVIGLLTRPKYLPISTGLPAITNRIDAHVRALSGSAIEQTNTARDITLAYSIFAEIVPMNFHAFQGNTNNSFVLANDPYSQKLQTNVFEIRLNFRWPLYPNGTVGTRRKIYRSYVSGRIASRTEPDGTELYFFQPDNFASLK